MLIVGVIDSPVARTGQKKAYNIADITSTIKTTSSQKLTILFFVLNILIGLMLTHLKIGCQHFVACCRNIFCEQLRRCCFGGLNNDKLKHIQYHTPK